METENAYSLDKAVYGSADSTNALLHSEVCLALKIREVDTPQRQGSEYKARHWLQCRSCAKNDLTHSVMELFPGVDG